MLHVELGVSLEYPSQHRGARRLSMQDDDDGGREGLRQIVKESVRARTPPADVAIKTTADPLGTMIS